MMEQLRNRFDQHNDLQKKIIIGAAILICLMLLFPPKIVSGHGLAEGMSRSAGFQFIFNDPTEGAGALGIATAGIAWIQLLIQLVVVGGVTIFLLGFVKNNPSAVPGNAAKTE